MSRTVLKISKGAIIVMGNSLNPGYVYILKSGVIQIESVFQFQNKNLNFYSPGDTFGYVSAITKNPHSSTLIANTDCIIIRMNLENFFDYLKQNKEVFLKILSYNSEKLQAFIEYIDPFKKENKLGFEIPERILEKIKQFNHLGQKRLACFGLMKYIQGNYSREKDPKSIEEAKKLLKQIDSRYTLPDYITYNETKSFAVKKGDIIFIELEPEDDFFYIIEQGSIKITKLLEGREIILGILTKGEIFGEMAILNKTVRNATAIAFEDSLLVRYTSSTLLEDSDSEILTKMFTVISRRLWFAYHRVFMLKVSDPNVKLYIQIQMLIADEISKTEHFVVKDKYIFRFSLNELLKMVDIEGIDSEKISEFLADKNLSFHNGQVVVKDKILLDEKVEAIKKKHIRLIKQIVL